MEQKQPSGLTAYGKLAHGSGRERRTLDDIPYYPKPQEIIQKLNERTGWNYRTKDKPKLLELYKLRDKALAALLYLGALRVSEVIRIVKNQFQNMGTHWLIVAVELSKSRVKGKPRRVRFRDAQLPLTGEREPLTRLVMAYVDTLGPNERLFPFSLEKNENDQIIGCKRAWQIVNALLPEFTEHWLRAFGEDYCYDKWDHDILAVSDYVKVDPRTLQEYLRKRHAKYPVV
jgi:integrase